MSPAPAHQMNHSLRLSHPAFTATPKLTQSN